jgi:hypothetical protein
LPVRRVDSLDDALEADRAARSLARSWTDKHALPA